MNDIYVTDNFFTEKISEWEIAAVEGLAEGPITIMLFSEGREEKWARDQKYCEKEKNLGIDDLLVTP